MSKKQTLKEVIERAPKSRRVRFDATRMAEVLLTMPENTPVPVTVLAAAVYPGRQLDKRHYTKLKELRNEAQKHMPKYKWIEYAFREEFETNCFGVTDGSPKNWDEYLKQFEA